MSTAVTARLQAIEIELPICGQSVEISLPLVRVIHKIANEQGFTLSNDSPAHQAKRNIEEKVKVLYEADLLLKRRRDANELRLQLYRYGLFVYWLPPVELTWLASMLTDVGVLTKGTFLRYGKERVRKIRLASV